MRNSWRRNKLNILEVNKTRSRTKLKQTLFDKLIFLNIEKRIISWADTMADLTLSDLEFGLHFTTTDGKKWIRFVFDVPCLILQIYKYFLILNLKKSILLNLSFLKTVYMLLLRSITIKELTLCHKFNFWKTYNFVTWWCKPWIFQTYIIWSNSIHSSKY